MVAAQHAVRSIPVSSPAPKAGRTLKSYGRYGSVGIEMVVTFVLATWLGSKGDARWGTAPWLTLLGIVVGAYAGLRALMKAAAHLTREAEAAEREEKDQRRGPPS